MTRAGVHGHAAGRIDPHEQAGRGPTGLVRRGQGVELPQHPVRGEVGGGDLAQDGTVGVHVDGGVQTVSHDVPDHQQGAAEVQAHGLEPVAADDGAGSDRQVAAGDLQVRVGAARFGDERPLQVQRGLLRGRQAPGEADVQAGEPGGEVHRRRLVVVEAGGGPGREEPSVGLVPADQGNRDEVDGPLRGAPGPHPQRPALVQRPYRGCAVGGGAFQQVRRARGGHALAPAAPAGHVHGRGAAQRTDEEPGQLPAGLPLVPGRSDTFEGLFHGVQACCRAVPLRHLASLARPPRAAGPRKAFHQPAPACGDQRGACPFPCTSTVPKGADAPGAATP